MSKILGKFSVFHFGLAIFFGTKVIFILFQTLILAGPRLGDDSLVYLSKGYASQHNYFQGHLLQENIDQLISKSVDFTPEGRIVLFRVAIQSQGAGIPLFDQLTAVILRLNLSDRWTFFAIELFVLASLTIFIGIGIKALFSDDVAGLTLIVVSTLIFPLQGLQYFVPSLMALSLGFLFFWLLGLHRRNLVGAISLVIFGLVAAGIHPISYIYLAISPYLRWGFLGTVRTIRSLWSILLYISIPCGLAIAVWIVITHNVPYFQSSPAWLIHQAYPDFSLFSNIEGAIKHLKFFVLTNLYGLFALFAGGSLLNLLRGPQQVQPNQRFFGYVFGIVTLVLTLFHVLPGYPADLFSRIFVMVSILYLAAFLSALRKSRLALPLVLIVYLIGVKNVSNYAYGNLERNSFVDSRRLQNELDLHLLPSDKIAYFESEYTFRAALLGGASRFNSLVLTPLVGSGFANAWLQDFNPDWGILALPREMNQMITQFSNVPLRPHKLGIYLDLLESLEVDAGGFRDKLSFEFEVADRSDKISFRCLSTTQDFTLPPAVSGLVTFTFNVPDQCAKFAISSAGKVLLTKLTHAEDSRRVSWPWDSNVVLRLIPIQESGAPTLLWRFDMQSILKSAGWDEIDRTENIKVKSDSAGALLLQFQKI